MVKWYITKDLIIKPISSDPVSHLLDNIENNKFYDVYSMAVQVLSKIKNDFPLC